ncbi:helix-turn-helix transcriptional regulator [Cryobacterium sp. MLB-32]|uniref:helix-turn-helix transcriptional regulator n=1 Tax=Cryobacterium sp. MLB-32 TaxID=1529318 RepID=UPI0006901D07|nr:helix-turn-helix transcriptional regulator [Cryobacterium sp. MLB-32]
MWVPITPGSLERVYATSGRSDLPGTDPYDLAERLFAADTEVFHFSAVKRVIGRSCVTLSTQSAFRLVGRADSEPGSLHVGFLLNGSVRISLGTGPSELFVPGSVYATSGWSVATLETEEITRGLDIQVPPDRLASRGVRMRRPQLRIDAGNSLANLLRTFALAVVSPAWKPSVVGELVAEHTLEDLVVGLLLESDGYARDSADLRVELRHRALTHIGIAYQDSDLTPSTLAVHLGVSLRHLQRSFEGSGSSIAAQIKKQRAQSAARLLGIPRSVRLSLAEVAERSGFHSASELRAVFRSQYGVLPSDYHASIDREGLALATREA